MVRKGLVTAMALVLIFGGLCIAAGSALAQAKPPADFTFGQGKDSPGTVTFSHEKHVSKDLKCTECHVKYFKMRKGSTDTKGGAMHGEKACGACHNGKGTFAASDKANCAKCHKK